jgi:hypothetical protein
MTDEERERRRSLYQRARDRAILALRTELRGRFAEEWPRVLERGVAEGIVEFDAKGTLRPRGALISEWCAAGWRTAPTNARPTKRRAVPRAPRVMRRSFFFERCHRWPSH